MKTLLNKITMDELTKAEFAKMAEQQRHQDSRLDKLEHSLEAINNLALSVQDLATNMKYMNDSIVRQGERLEALERQPLESYKDLKLSTIKTAVGIVVGIIIGALIKSIIPYL